MGSVLFIIYGERFKILEDLILELSKKKQVNILFLTEPSKMTLEILDNRSIGVYYIYTDRYLKSFQWLLIRISKYKNYSFFHLLKEKSLLISLKRTYNFALKLFEQLSIQAIYSHNDRYATTTIAYLKAGYAMGIPIVIPAQHPFELDFNYINKDDQTKHIHDASTSYEKKVFSEIMLQNSSQAHEGYFYYKAFELNAMQKWNVLPANPWIVGSSYMTTKLCVMTQYNKDYLIQEKLIEEKKIEVIGHISYDKIYAHYVLDQKYKKLDRKLMIVSLDQLYEHGVMNLEGEKGEFEFILSTLKQFSEYEVVLSLKPTMKEEDYSYLETMFDCKISNQKLHDIIHLADLFVCTMMSSTIYWALLLNIRTVVYNVYGLSYQMYNQFSTVKYVCNRGELAVSIRDLIESQPIFENDEKLLSKERVFHGNVIDLYINLTNGLKRVEQVFYNCRFTVAELLIQNFSLWLNNNSINKAVNFVNSKGSYYFAPYSDLTYELSKNLLDTHLIESTFRGYIDFKKEGIDIYRVEDIDSLEDSRVIISSPNYGQEIYEKLRQVFCDDDILYMK